jgi:hypothetical protein
VSNLSEELVACGFAVAGEPPMLTVDVGGRAVRVTARGEPVRVDLEAHLSGSGLAEEQPMASHLMAGDTRIGEEGPDVVARRTLVEPPRWLLHEAVHQLARLVCAASVPSRPAEGTAGEPGARPAGGEAAPRTPSIWVFVDEATGIHPPGDAVTVVAMLMPGSWYEVLAQEGAWVHVRHSPGLDGWVERTKVVFS